MTVSRFFNLLGVFALCFLSLNLFPVQAQDQVVTVLGSGASFPELLIKEWAQDFKDKSGGRVQVNYGGGGSGKGVADFLAKLNDFAASDAPLNTNERANATNNGVHFHIPETLGAVVMVFNIPGFTGDLILNGDIIAKIYQLNITKWNDAQIVALNPQATLPDQDIKPVRRSDSSGTTFAFSDFLDRSTANWTLGTAKSIQWPEGVQGGPQNAGVAAAVQNTQYAIGYVEYGYAQANPGFKVAKMVNKAGNVISATPESMTAAAQDITLPNGEDSWSTVSIADHSGATSWPIASFTYLLVYQNLTAKGEVGAALVAFLKWIMTSEAQNKAPTLGYAALSESVITNALRSINMIQYDTAYNPDDYLTASGQVAGFESAIVLVSIIIVSVITKRKLNR